MVSINLFGFSSSHKQERQVGFAKRTVFFLFGFLLYKSEESGSVQLLHERQMDDHSFYDS